LPLASSVANQVFYIVDETGNASTNNIILTISSNDTILGDTSITINTNYASLMIMSNGTDKYCVL